MFLTLFTQKGASIFNWSFWLAGNTSDLAALLLRLMSVPNEDNMTSHSQVSLSFMGTHFVLWLSCWTMGDEMTISRSLVSDLTDSSCTRRDRSPQISGFKTCLRLKSQLDDRERSCGTLVCWAHGRKGFFGGRGAGTCKGKKIYFSREIFIVKLSHFTYFYFPFFCCGLLFLLSRMRYIIHESLYQLTLLFCWFDCTM